MKLLLGYKNGDHANKSLKYLKNGDHMVQLCIYMVFI